MASGDDLSAAMSEFQKAVTRGNNDRIKKLIEGSETLLHDAAKKNVLHLVRQMLEHGAKVNARADKGVTPLHVAAQHASKEVVSLLLQNGAMIDAVDDLNTKPVDVAKNKEISDLLIATEKLHESVLNNNSTEVQKQLRAGAVVNARDSEGNTPLHNAAMKGLDGMVEILLDKNANVDMNGSGGFTPLHCAAKMSQVIIAKSLLFHGATFEAADDEGKTPSNICKRKSSLSKLFKLIRRCFEKIKNNDGSIRDDLVAMMIDKDTMKAVFGTKSNEKRTLIMEAMHGQFSKLKELRNMLQPQVTVRVGGASSLIQKGKYQEALELLKTAFEERLQLLGLNNPFTLEVQSDIAQVLYKLGSYPESMKIYKEVCQRQTKVFGCDAKETLHTMSNMALILHRQEKGKEALKMLEEVHHRQIQLLGPDDVETLCSLFHKGITLEGLSRPEEALAIYKTVYEKRKKALGPDNMATLAAQTNIAKTLVNIGRCSEALEIFREVFKRKRETLGMDHSDVIKTLNSIATVLTKMEKPDDAIKAFEDVLKNQIKVFPPNHPELLNTKYTMANLLYYQKMPINALKLYKEILEPLTVLHGPEHRMVKDVVQNIGTISCDEEEVLMINKNGLKTAIEQGDLEQVQFFLNNGANVNEEYSEGATPLHFAISKVQLKILRNLLKNDADITLVTEKDGTPLHTAVEKGSTPMVEMLLQNARHHSKIDQFVDAQKTSNLETALHVAARIGRLDIVKLLLSFGATYQMIDIDGRTPLDVATIDGVKDLLKWVDDVFEDLKVGRIAAHSKLRSLKPEEILPITNARNFEGKTLMTVAITKIQGCEDTKNHYFISIVDLLCSMAGKCKKAVN